MTGTLDRFSFSASSPAASWVSLNEDKGDEEYQLGQAELFIDGNKVDWYSVVCWLAQRSVVGKPPASVRLTGNGMLASVEFFGE